MVLLRALLNVQVYVFYPPQTKFGATGERFSLTETPPDRDPWRETPPRTETPLPDRDPDLYGKVGAVRIPL